MADSELDREARAVLDSYAAQRAPSGEALARVRSGVEKRIVAGDPGMPLEAVASASRRGWWIGGGIGAAGAAVALLLGLQGEPDSGGRPTGAAPAMEAPTSIDTPSVLPLATEPAVAPMAKPPRPDGDPVPVTEEPDASPAEPASAKTRKRPREPEPSAPGANASEEAYDQVKAEMALLGRAQAALQAGDAADALRLLDRHRRKYPRGYLAEERMLQRMVALCELGEVQEARRAVRKFLEARPNSPMASHASSICKDREPKP